MLRITNNSIKHTLFFYIVKWKKKFSFKQINLAYKQSQMAPWSTMIH